METHDPAEVPDISLGEFLERPHQSVSRAYQVTHAIFRDDAKFCEEVENPSGQKFLLTPAAAISRAYDSAADYVEPAEKTDDDIYERHAGRVKAIVQFGVRVQGRKPVLDTPYHLIIDGNVTNPIYSINRIGEFIRDSEGEEFSYLKEIGEIADVIRTDVIDKRKEKHHKHVVRGVVAGVLIALGAAGGIVYEELHTQSEQEQAKINQFDNRNLVIGGVAIKRLATDQHEFVPAAHEQSVGFDSIPNLSDDDNILNARRTSITSGTCRHVLSDVGVAQQVIVEKDPNVTALVEAIVTRAGDVYICVPQKETTGSGQDEKTVSDAVAIQVVSQ